jgi:PKD repeat protein
MPKPTQQESKHMGFPGCLNGEALWPLILIACLGVTAHAQSGPGTALSFNGEGQRVRIADFFTNAPTTEVTVEFWQNASGLREQSSFSQDDSTRTGWDPSNVFNAHVPYSDGRVYWDFGDIGGEGRLYYTPPVPIVGTWQHFAFVASQSGNFMRIYRNGILEAEKAGMTPLTEGSFDLDISGENNSLWQVSFDGILDEFRVWDVARSQPQIEAFMYSSLPLPQANLVAYWRFDEGTGEVAHDASGNGRDGILVNGPQWSSSDPRNLWIEASYTNVAIGYRVLFIARDTGPMLQTVWDFGDGTVLTNQFSATHAWSAPGAYTVRLTGYNDSDPGGVTTNILVTVAEAVHYVAAASGSPVPPYTSWATAATTIQDAVDKATLPGALVLVTNGVYATGGRAVCGTMTNRVAVDKPLRLRSVNGPKFAVIQGRQVPGTTNGDGAIRCVYVTNGASLVGFTLSNGATRAEGDYPACRNGGGVWCESETATVSNCVMAGNSAWDGGGGAYGGTLDNCTLTGNSASIGAGASSSTLYNCTLTGNNAKSWGGGVFGSVLYNCTLTGNAALPDEYGNGGYGGGAFEGALYNCTLTGNSAKGGGGALGGILYNCTVTGNSAAEGGGAGAATLYNCTITGNRATKAGGGACGLLLMDPVPVSMVNCVVYFNTAPRGANYGGNGWECSLDFCCTSPLPEPMHGVGNISSDPQLASLSHLSASSPCRGAGNAAYGSGTDIDGEAWAAPPSIGCDEYHFGAVTGPLNVGVEAAYTNVATGFLVDLTAMIDGRTTASVWEFGDGMVASNWPHASHIWTVAGDYTVVLRAYNESYPGGVTATQVVHVVPAPVHYVATNSANPLPPYTSWSTAATNIQDAVDAAGFVGGTILVSNGVYAAGGRAVVGDITNRLAVDKRLVVQSINGPQFTIVQGDWEIRCVYLTRGASLSGFTLTQGFAEGNGGGVCCESVSALVSNCVLIANGAGDEGGGASGGTLYNCALIDNWAINVGGGAARSALNNCSVRNNSVCCGSGGGAYSGTLNNCTLTGNAAEYAGGGASASSLNNCTLAGNRVDGTDPGAGGGGAYGGTLNNCIVYFNTATNGANYWGDWLPNYCCTTPMPTNGVGNIDNAPLFVDPAAGDLRLQANSPCINSGNNSYVTNTTDLDGNPRIVSGTVDIGAYEFQGPGSMISYAWLQHYGLPTDGSADATDLDADGHTTWQEWRCLTDPTNALSVLRLLSASPGGTNVTVSWQSVAGVNYFLERSTDLAASPPFTTLATGIPGQPGTTTFTDTSGAGLGPFFYRVGVNAP